MRNTSWEPVPFAEEILRRPMIITALNYHSDENTAISNSKVSDFLVSKEFFKRKYIDKTVPREVTKPMKIGLMVDDLFSGNPMSFTIKLQMSCLKKDNPELYEKEKRAKDAQDALDIPDEEMVTRAEFDEAQGRAEAIMREPFYQWFKDKGSQFQYPLNGVVKHKGNLLPICGLADVITETKDTVYIDDGKSTNAQKVKTISKWFYACKEMGYLRQLAVYVNLWKQMHPKDKRKIVTRHYCVYEAKKGVFKVKLFVIPAVMLKKPWKEFVSSVKAIADEKYWVDEPVTWDQARMLHDPKEKTFDDVPLGNGEGIKF